MTGGMSGREIWDLLDDLEQQAEGLALHERDLEVADRSRTEYSAVRMAARLHVLGGQRVRLRLLGGLVVTGQIVRTGADWVLLDDESGSSWLVPHEAIGTVHGADPRAMADEALGVVRRLSLRSVLRGLADAGAPCVFHLRDGARWEGQVLRVGADFAEARTIAEPSATLVPFGSLAAVQSRYR